MCNCGNKRMAYSQQSYGGNVGNLDKRMGIPLQTNMYVIFEYTGRTALSITGNKTGTQYRFNSTGNRQNIDHRDVPGMLTIPVLRKV